MYKHLFRRGFVQLRIHTPVNLKEIAGNYGHNFGNVSDMQRIDVCLQIGTENRYEISDEDVMLFVVRDLQLTSIKLLIDNLFVWLNCRAGVYMLHASSAIKGNEVILFFGPPHSGKTAIALELAINHGYGFLSGNTVYVKYHNRKLYSLGTHQTYIKYKEESLAHPESVYHSIHSAKIKPSSCGKYRLDMKQFGPSVQKYGGFVRRAYLTNVRSPLDKHVVNIDKEIKYFLNEEMKRILFGTNGVLIGANGEFTGWPPSLDDEVTKVLRADILSCLIEDIGVEYVGGTLKYIVGTIERHAKN